MLFDQSILKNNESILDGNKLRQNLESALPQAKNSVIFISAYVTQNAVEWLHKFIPKDIDTRIICRLLPSDVLSGATQLSAITVALEKGIEVYCLHSLHAKIFVIDFETIYVGSANLTNSGLKIYGTGNLEACIKVPGSSQNLGFIQNILNSCTLLNKEIIKKMHGYIELKATGTTRDQWPEDIMKEDEGIWVRDLFWTQPGKNDNSLEYNHDLDLLGLDSADSIENIPKENVLKTRCVRWLTHRLEIEPGNELYFGNLTKILHDELKDDPAPYRKNVKSLLYNLLFYVKVYLKGIIEVSTPRHSQKIKLIKTPK